MKILIRQSNKKEVVQLKNGVIYEVCNFDDKLGYGEKVMTDQEMEQFLKENKLQCLMKNDIS